MIQIFLSKYKDIREAGGWLSLLFLVGSITLYDFLSNCENFMVISIMQTRRSSVLLAVLCFFDIDRYYYKFLEKLSKPTIHSTDITRYTRPILHVGCM